MSGAGTGLEIAMVVLILAGPGVNATVHLSGVNDLVVVNARAQSEHEIMKAAFEKFITRMNENKRYRDAPVERPKRPSAPTYTRTRGDRRCSKPPEVNLAERRWEARRCAQR
jgi:hypothetical protein